MRSYTNQQLTSLTVELGGAEGFVYQALAPMPQFEGRYPVIGSWIVGDSAAGMCLREDTRPVTTNMSQFVPHFFE